MEGTVLLRTSRASSPRARRGGAGSEVTGATGAARAHWPVAARWAGRRSAVPALRLPGTVICAFAGLRTHLRAARQGPARLPFRTPGPVGGSGVSGRVGFGWGRGDRGSNLLGGKIRLSSLERLLSSRSPKDWGQKSGSASPGTWPRDASCRMRSGSSRGWEEL